MANTVTITAKDGPAVQSTAVLITNVTSILYDWFHNTVSIFTSGPLSPYVYELTGVATITTTVSGGNNNVTIS
jgi:hypothetical protein